MSSDTRITENIFAETAEFQLNRLSSDILKKSKQLESGQKFQRVSEEPEATGRIMRDQAVIREASDLKKSAGRAESITEKTYSTVEQLFDIVTRAQEIGYRAGATSISDYPIYETEVNSLIEEFLNVANSRYQGEYIFAGTAGTVAPYAATRDVNNNVVSVAYTGNTNSAEFYVSKDIKLSPYTSGANNLQFLSAVNNGLVALRDALSASNVSGVEATNTTLISEGDSIADVQASVSSRAATIYVAQAQNDFSIKEGKKSIAFEAGADFVSVASELTKLKTAYEASSVVLASIMQNNGLLVALSR